MAFLSDALADAIPSGLRLGVYHFSTPPTSCPPLFSALSGLEPERTTCEGHFLAIAIRRGDDNEDELLVFALEVLIYSTEELTTIFVSKADSTGYLHLLKQPPGSPSLIKTITSSFLSFLVQQRPQHSRLVLSLFARSQNQYLFPGSVENSGKHVLDDRELIKWWCHVLDPILREYGPDSQEEGAGSDVEANGLNSTYLSTAYVLVPGCDRHETRAFFPPSTRSDAATSPRWLSSHPLLRLAKDPTLPPRCLVPRFPDDPKARFLNDLDGEIFKLSEPDDEPQMVGDGRWKSVKSLEQFWDMMAFRQECSAGRLVGFIWLVFTPTAKTDTTGTEISSFITANGHEEAPALPTPNQSQAQEPVLVSSFSDPPEPTIQSASPPPSSPIEAAPSSQAMHRTEAPITASFDRPPQPTTNTDCTPSSPGSLILPYESFQSITSHLLTLDFATEALAAQSTRSWTDQVTSSAADGKPWGKTIVGRDTSFPSGKRKAEDMVGQTTGEAGAAARTGVNVLNAGLVRKKVKVRNG